MSLKRYPHSRNHLAHLTKTRLADLHLRSSSNQVAGTGVPFVVGEISLWFTSGMAARAEIAHNEQTKAVWKQKTSSQ
jgi:hypothetical protein